VSPNDPEAPIVLVFHGLTGGATAAYVARFVNYLSKATDRKWKSVVLNARGWGSPLTKPKTYSAAFTEDIRAMVAHVKSVYPKAPLFGIGFSLGANLLAKYLGEVGAATPLLAAVGGELLWRLYWRFYRKTCQTICDTILTLSAANPFDFTLLSSQMGNGLRRYLYGPFMVNTLLAYITK
jgi:predicted alpha/beta-fold hydrolase